MDERLQDIKAVFEQWCRGKGSELDVDDIKWLIEQVDELDKLKNTTELRMNKLTPEQIEDFKRELYKEWNNPPKENRPQGIIVTENFKKPKF